MHNWVQASSSDFSGLLRRRGDESDGQVGPTPPAFHVAITIDCHMFIFGLEIDS
ncbi:hypothetical protein ARALYDRAFT_902938 [Arabidopsis lyrata subsp. lyrata]|uniref:Uncharacterized protein n=1 Tax=Arabidopsis lyrata subsp. lyrata TaxID=81972 RepID=D7LKE2_ARALL|nr:hypothetical protein ARALYDRAFT_902938 [Arabidopsis lyrata subsp. lyrata]